MLESAFLWGVATVAFAISVFASLAEGAIFFHAPSRLENEPDERRRLEQVAEENGITVTELLRFAIQWEQTQPGRRAPFSPGSPS